MAEWLFLLTITNNMDEILHQIHLKTAIPLPSVRNVIQLLEEGCTIPFICRYRKEKTGGLDEVQVSEILKLYQLFEKLKKRKTYILQAIEQKNALTVELKNKIEQCWDESELEDLFLPYKEGKKTRADRAREAGLEPMAKIIMAQKAVNLMDIAQKYTCEAYPSPEDVMEGALEIVASWINQNPSFRKMLRKIYDREAVITARIIKGKEEEADKYRDYFDFNSHLFRCPSYRILAIFRAEREGFLKVKISVEKDILVNAGNKFFLKKDNPEPQWVQQSVKHAIQKLLMPSLENEYRKKIKEKADDEAIKIFSGNLMQLLMEPPLGQKNVLAIDPGFRTGCKVVCLNKNGDLLHNQNIYPFGENGNPKQAARQIKTLVNQFKIEAIALGDGTASRETENLLRSIHFDRDVKAYVVSEDGASVYSVSDLAREEFPSYDVTVRGAVSIGRRLMDPLSELVKIDPKSLGVGQYQHDVDSVKLKQALDQTTERCVNSVGINVNLASKYVLRYVSGIGESLAENIISYRTKNGSFKNREELKKVPRMGEKAFQQCAGFLRIPDGTNPLDNTGIHPESYYVVDKMAHHFQISIDELMKNSAVLDSIRLQDFADENTGIETLKDIIEELKKPGRDPRKAFSFFQFDKNIHSIEDVKPGMVLPGIVTNITDFGAFVNIGIKENGLLHKSRMAEKFVQHPSDIVYLHQHLKVKVIDVDINRKRIGLSLIDL